ncbi:MAG: Na+/H+ antiporter NhaD/arsenite permease-like protein [Bacteroidia bacterium]|jgi:Na+/H+ antiporter NhaD/arsenite permease-like protein
MILIIIFVLGYLCIALEHVLKIDKAATAITTGVLCWVAYALGHQSDLQHINEELILKLGEISSILFFLICAMTIVELIDTYNGFEIITNRISTTSPLKLLWIVGIITFILSAILDNLTTAIVMAALLRKLIKEKDLLWIFGGFVIISANAGGAFSPIGDVTTIMLWVGGQVTTGSILTKDFVPSVVCLLVPLIMASFTLRNLKTMSSDLSDTATTHLASKREETLVLILGVTGLISVPVFKTFTHLPPFMGILLSLGILWIITERMHVKKNESNKKQLKIHSIIQKIDTSSVLFFLGILLAVGSLEIAGHLNSLAILLDENIGNMYMINVAIGLLSAIVDNVPLVAGAMGMYDLNTYPVDHNFWTFLAYTAGTGGSVLIIGSAAGVAIMSALKIDFIWYVKKISLFALCGYLAGSLVYILLNA